VFANNFEVTLIKGETFD